MFLEFPGTDLEPSPEPVEHRFGGRRVTIIPIEGLLADRLAAWKFWKSGVDAVNALLLLRSSSFPTDLNLARELSRTVVVDDPTLAFGGPRQQHFLDNLWQRRRLALDCARQRIAT